MLRNISRSFGLGQILWNCVRNGNVREVWNAGCEVLGYARVTEHTGQRISDVQITFGGNTGRHTRKGKTERGVFFSMEREIKIINHDYIFVHKRITLAVNAVEFVSHTMSYREPRGRSSDNIVLNAHAPTDDKSHGSKNSVYE
jgi:hypothetical protein